MRPPSVASSTFRHPFDLVLGSTGNVRVLRTLAMEARPLVAPEIVERTKLNHSGTLQILTSLAQSGLIEVFGSARSKRYQLRREHPLAVSLVALFDAEASRATQVLDDIRAVVNDASSASHGSVLALWLYGSVARGDDGPRSDLDLAIVFEEESRVDASVHAIRQRIEALETRACISISVLGLSTADVRRLAGGDPWWETLRADAVPLLGVAPDSLAERVGRRRTKV